LWGNVANALQQSVFSICKTLSQDMFPSQNHNIGIAMTSRRQFIQIVPLAGAALVVGCSDKASEAPKPVASTAPATPPPAPAPVAAAPATEPTPAPASPAPSAAANASALPMVDEKDPTASALGYVANATKADTAKYKTYAAGQQCSGCQLFQGQAGAAAGPCSLFAGKQVSAQGWCSAFAKKTA
jgi:High potential iron-sulfur protein